MLSEPIVQLHHGLQAGGTRHREATVRAPTGRDEALIESCAPAAVVTSALIAAMVARIGTIAPITPEIASRLTVGDRERLLLAIAIMTVGNVVELVAHCPAPSCRALADVPLRLSDFLQPGPSADPPFAATFQVSGPGGLWTLTARPPIGADQERGAHNGTDAARELMLACLLDVTNPAGDAIPAHALPAELESGLGEALLAFDPAAESLSTMPCPSCGTTMDVLLDGFALLRSALGGTLDSEVYRMARAYHWGENEILALPVDKRRRYLAIASSMETGA